MKTIKQYMTENKSEVIDIIEDEVRFSNTNLKEVSNILINANDSFQLALSVSKPTQWDSVEEVAFKSVLKTIVENIVLSTIDNSEKFWSIIKEQVKRQSIN